MICPFCNESVENMWKMEALATKTQVDIEFQGAPAYKRQKYIDLTARLNNILDDYDVNLVWLFVCYENRSKSVSGRYFQRYEQKKFLSNFTLIFFCIFCIFFALKNSR